MMKLLKVAALVLGLAPMAAMASAAHATTATFDWSLTEDHDASFGDFSVLASGELTATDEGAGVWQVTSLTVTGSTADALETSYTSPFYKVTPDDLVYTNADSAYLDTNGIAFDTPAGQKIEIYSFFAPGSAPSGNAYGEFVDGLNGGVGHFSLAQVSAAPEPAVWMLMLAGIGGAGLMLRRAKAVRGLAVSA
jgi:hypothetical protein